MIHYTVRPCKLKSNSRIPRYILCDVDVEILHLNATVRPPCVWFRNVKSTWKLITFKYKRHVLEESILSNYASKKFGKKFEILF